MRRNASTPNNGLQKPDRDGEPFFTPTTLALRWHRHPEGLRRWIRAGKIASIVIGRRRLIPREAVLAFEAAGLLPATDRKETE